MILVRTSNLYDILVDLIVHGLYNLEPSSLENGYRNGTCGLTICQPLSFNSAVLVWEGPSPVFRQKGPLLTLKTVLRTEDAGSIIGS